MISPQLIPSELFEKSIIKCEYELVFLTKENLEKQKYYGKKQKNLKKKMKFDTCFVKIH